MSEVGTDIMNFPENINAFPENKYSEFSWIKGNPDIGEGTWIGPFVLLMALAVFQLVNAVI